MDRAQPVAADQPPHPRSEQDVRDRGARGADADEHDLHVLGSLPDHAERVQERRQHDDRGAVLIVVEDRNVEPVAQPLLDLEAARRGDVLEVDPAEARSDRAHRRDDLVHVLRREAERPGVDAAELLEQHRLPLHHRQRRFRADVAEPEDGCAVGDDRDCVLLHGQVPDELGALGDRGADARHTRRVRHREVVPRLQRRLRRHLDLAAFMQVEGAVRDVLDLDAGERADGVEDRLEVRRIGCEDGDVADLRAALDADEVDRVEQAARVADRLGQPGERAGPVVEVDAERR